MLSSAEADVSQHSRRLLELESRLQAHRNKYNEARKTLAEEHASALTTQQSLMDASSSQLQLAVSCGQAVLAKNEPLAIMTVLDTVHRMSALAHLPRPHVPTDEVTVSFGLL